VYHGQGEWYQAGSGLTYRGRFLAGVPERVPTGLTLTWMTDEDPKKGGRKAAPAAKGSGWEPEVAPLLPVRRGVYV
jgi:hypothetical protein